MEQQIEGVILLRQNVPHICFKCGMCESKNLGGNCLILNANNIKCFTEFKVHFHLDEAAL